MSSRARPTFAVITLIAAVTLSVVGCASSGSALATSRSDPASGADSSATVHIKGYAFVPGTVTVAPGGTITFVNDDQVAHTATGSDGAFDTGNIAPGKSAVVHIPRTARRTVAYLCSIHQFMNGTVIVKP